MGIPAMDWAIYTNPNCRLLSQLYSQPSEKHGDLDFGLVWVGEWDQPYPPHSFSSPI